MKNNNRFYSKQSLFIGISAILGIFVYIFLTLKIENSDKQETQIAPKKFDLETLLSGDNFNESIIEIDNHIGQLCSYGDAMEKLTEPQKQFYYIQRFEAEVYNGGFSQYFYNSSGDFAHETVTTLKEIGAFTTALILQDAINQFPDKKVPQDRIKRQDILEKIEIPAESTWNNLDEKFYNSEEDLNVLVFEFIKKHKDKF